MRRRRRGFWRWAWVVVAVPVAMGFIPGVPHPGLQLFMWWVPIPPRVDVPSPREGVERVLVLAPHPDDEVLGAGGAIVDFLAQGHQVLVVFLTAGDANTAAKRFFTWNPLNRPEDYQALGYRRMKEAGEAMRILGVPWDHILFLGYPDRGLHSLWTTYREKIYRSPYTKMDHPFYRNSFNPEARYKGEDLLEDLCTILRTFHPTIIYCPHPEDSHPDHRATALFLQAALGEVFLAPEIRYYLVHGQQWPTPLRLIPDAELSAPSYLADRWDWRTLPLSEETVEKKLAALRAYSSQRVTNGRFLAAFVRQNEVYALDLLEKPVLNR
ncbi:PIG-L family deacetylase [Candidatus Bipolaricaulota bacterium]|nr:PIG-L family deacetylase [Candidatus Bipolaricaulota bacterium]